jgi:hypothetical protein
MKVQLPVPARTPATARTAPVRCLAALLFCLVAGGAQADEPQSISAVCYGEKTPIERLLSDVLDDARGLFDLGFRFVSSVPGFVGARDPQPRTRPAAARVPAASGGAPRLRYPTAGTR